MTIEEIEEQLVWLKGELEKLKKELSRVDEEIVGLRQEVAGLAGQVRRNNSICVDTQSEVQGLRREAENGFDGVNDSLTEIINHLRGVNGPTLP